MAEIEDVITAFITKQQLALGAAMKAALEEIELPQAKDECPYEFGDLSATGMVSDPVVDAGAMTTTVAIGFGLGGEKANMAEIAVLQHERSDYNHPGGKKWKYLEDPVSANASTFLKRVAEKMGK